MSSSRPPARALLAAAVALSSAAASARPSAAAPAPLAEDEGSGAALETVTEPDVHPTLLWFVTQLLPSPSLDVAEGGGRLDAHFAVRWQITPLLYSFGINRKLSPWRTFVVEPLVRHAGSVEIFASPEYLAASPVSAASFRFRGGLRAYFPLAHRGEYLSWSIGGSAFHAHTQLGVAYEVGLYTLGGVLGAQVTFSPTPGIGSTMATLSLRYF